MQYADLCIVPLKKVFQPTGLALCVKVLHVVCMYTIFLFTILSMMR